MKTLIITLFISLVAFTNCFSQSIEDELLVFNSIAGTYDKTMNPARAQFAGNNKLLQAHMDQYREALAVIEVGTKREMYQEKPYFVDTNRTTALSFKVTNEGKVENVKVLKPSGMKKLDAKIKKVIEATSGLWRPGMVAGNRVEDNIKIYVHVYSGKKKEKTYEQFMKEGDTFYANKDYKKAIESYNGVLSYNLLNAKAAAQKGMALLKMDKEGQACYFWKSYQKYDMEEITAALKAHCK